MISVAFYEVHYIVKRPTLIKFRAVISTNGKANSIFEKEDLDDLLFEVDKHVPEYEVDYPLNKIYWNIE